MRSRRIRREVLELFAKEAPVVSTFERFTSYWTGLAQDEVDEQEWLTNLLSTDPRVLNPSQKVQLDRESREFIPDYDDTIPKIRVQRRYW